MFSIIKAEEANSALLADIGRKTFFESHGRSASSEDTNSYANEKFTNNVLIAELRDAANIYHIIYQEAQPAGYSKIIYNVPHINIEINNVSKLDRIYLLEEYYNLKLGYELLKFNFELARKNDQSGVWLYVWKENHRAVNFYKKAGFKIIGSYDFKLSETHSNPNHQMLLIF